MVTIAVLSIIFFSIAAWNLGSSQVPQTMWKTNQPCAFTVDMGKPENVGTAYLLVKNGSANVVVYTGFPGNWSYSSSIKVEYPFGYYKWMEASIHRTTRYIRFDIEQVNAIEQVNLEVAEMAVDNNSQRIELGTVTGENKTDPTLTSLTDEQGLVQVPPTYMSETYFDEVYFVRTGEQYLHLQAPYEWTHPPLGKLIIASSIAFFGFNPFGWRILGVVFATLMIPVIYLLGKKLFDTWIGAFAAAFLLSFDFMHFTMARMATVDTYVVFFSLVSQLFFLVYFKDVLKNGWKASIVSLFLAVLFFGLGFATKWIVLYGFAAEMFFLFVLRLREVWKIQGGFKIKLDAFTDPPYFKLLWFIGAAVLVYFLTYIPYLLMGYSLGYIFQLQGDMYIYHSTLNATHPFSSAWWSWPLIQRPVWLFVSDLPKGFVSTIAVFGNPAVWWVGFACIFLVTERAVRGKERALQLWKMFTKRLQAVKRKMPFFSRISALMKKESTHRPSVAENTSREWDSAAIFIAVMFFFQWLPYVLISRLTFIYHYYISVPFLCLAPAYFLSRYWNRLWGKAAALAYFTAVVVLFILFFPVISGMPAPSSQVENLRWFGSWTF